MTDYLADMKNSIWDAAMRLDGIAVRTPLTLNERLSELTGARVWLKREDLQPVRSYKLRGAYNLISQLSEEQREKGVVCASAGNHGQGVAWACASLGITGSIFVPSTTPRQKRDRMTKLGGKWAELNITGDNYDQAQAAAVRFAAQTGATMVPAFDHVRTIAGQGTVAKEIVEQLGHAPNTLVVPVGGGGMLAGCAAWLHGESTPRGQATRLIGVEPTGAASMSAALAAGKPVDLEKLDTFIDGASVQRVGRETFRIARDTHCEMVEIPVGQVASEMLKLYQTDGVIAEPAGALAPAALGSPIVCEPGTDVVVIISGGNNDLSRYAEISEKALVYEGRKHYFLVTFPQEPGALRRFLDDVLGPDDDITLFEYIKRSNREKPGDRPGVGRYRVGASRRPGLPAGSNGEVAHQD